MYWPALEKQPAWENKSPSGSAYSPVHPVANRAAGRPRDGGGRAKKKAHLSMGLFLWRRQDLNLRPSGYEPDELPTAPLRDVGPQRYGNSRLKTKQFLINFKTAYLYPMQSWLSYHIYPVEAPDVFLTRAVKPFLETVIWPHKGLRAFFIRYDDEKGRHIRLRLAGGAEWMAETARPALEGWMEGRGELIEQPYAAEPARFGGENPLRLAEEYFHVSTRVVLERLARQPRTYGDALFDALRLHLITAFAAGFDREKTSWYFRELCGQWTVLFFQPADGSSDPEAAAELRRHFQETFDAQKEDLRLALDGFWTALEKGKFDPQQTEWLRWLRGNQLILKELGPNLDRALPSLIHLTNNRLGLNNQDEVYINFVLGEAI
jgi:thiopeptide-type bacteriocin biosynthesis protein